MTLPAVTTHYPCLVVHDLGNAAGGGPCASIASYFAKDNRARLGHVCQWCWRAMSEAERALYEKRTNT